MAESCYVCGESLIPNSGRRVMSDQLKSFLRLEVSSGHLYLCKTCYSKTNKGANQEAAARNILHELWTTIRETGITTNSTVSSYHHITLVIHQKRTNNSLLMNCQESLECLNMYQGEFTHPTENHKLAFPVFEPFLL